MKRIIIESSLRALIRQELLNHLNENNKKEILEEGILDTIKRMIIPLMLIGAPAITGTVGAKIAYDSNASQNDIEVLNNIADAGKVKSEMLKNAQQNFTIKKVDDGTYQLSYKNRIINTQNKLTQEMVNMSKELKQIDSMPSTNTKTRGQKKTALRVYEAKNQKQYDELAKYCLEVVNAIPEIKNFEQGESLMMVAALMLLLSSPIILNKAIAGGANARDRHRRFRF